MRPRIKKNFEPCYIVRHNEQDVIFGVNLVSYDERAKIAQKKKDRIAEENKKKEESKKEQEKFFSYRLFGDIYYLPMSKKTENLEPFIVQENLEVPSVTV
jgi:hypothetical protein